MPDKVDKRPRRPWWLIFAAACLLCGCSSNRFTFFPERHNMLESTYDIRKATPIPPQIARELDKHVLPVYLVEPGDVLLATASELDSPVRLPGDQPVLSDGTISLGRFGRPVVAGK